MAYWGDTEEDPRRRSTNSAIEHKSNHTFKIFRKERENNLWLKELWDIRDKRSISDMKDKVSKGSIAKEKDQKEYERQIKEKDEKIQEVTNSLEDNVNTILQLERDLQTMTNERDENKRKRELSERQVKHMTDNLSDQQTNNNRVEEQLYAEKKKNEELEHKETTMQHQLNHVTNSLKLERSLKEGNVNTISLLERDLQTMTNERDENKRKLEISERQVQHLTDKLREEQIKCDKVEDERNVFQRSLENERDVHRIQSRDKDLRISALERRDASEEVPCTSAMVENLDDTP